MKFNIQQHCQIANLQEVYDALLPDQTKGTFVEVGAYDGVVHSNTSFLADIGWNGLYIEPIKELFDQCCANHVRNTGVKCVNCAIGSENKEVNIHVGGTLSTIDEDTFQFFRRQEWSCNYVVGGLRPVQQRRLEDVMTEAGIPVGFDLLVVDVEGYELSVFQSFDLDYWKPRVMIVEIAGDIVRMQGHSSGMLQKAEVLRGIILSHGYTSFQDDGMNVIYTRS